MSASADGKKERSFQMWISQSVAKGLNDAVALEKGAVSADHIREETAKDEILDAKNDIRRYYIVVDTQK